jgi:hypothetical protein
MHAAAVLVPNRSLPGWPRKVQLRPVAIPLCVQLPVENLARNRAEISARGIEITGLSAAAKNPTFGRRWGQEHVGKKMSKSSLVIFLPPFS